MSEKPEALRLADALRDGPYLLSSERDAAEAVLRRQHAEIERLREALTYDWDQLDACRESLREHMVEIKRLRELLKEARDSLGCEYDDAVLNLTERIDAVLRREDV